MVAGIAQADAASDRVTIANTMRAVAALSDGWRQLSAAAPPNVFLTFDWYSIWMEHLLAGGLQGQMEPWVLAVRGDETTIGIAPLVRRTVTRAGWRVRKLEFVTTHADYNELVLGAEAAGLNYSVLAELGREARNWELIDLMDLRDDCGQVESLERAVQGMGLAYHVFNEPAGCLYMPIDGPWQHVRTKKYLRFARRAWAAFEEHVSDGYRVRVIDEPHCEQGLLERIIAVEAQKQVDGQPTKPVIGAYPDIFQKLINQLGPSKTVAVVVVEQNERLVAWRWLYRCGNALWDYLTAYDHAFGEMSPGTLLLCAALDYGFAQGCTEFDFLRGMDTYKQRWTTTFRRNRRMIIWNRRWQSRVAAMLYLNARRRMLSGQVQ